MARKTEVANRIIACLKDMESTRKEQFNGEWRDYGNDSGNVIKMEALMCFLLTLDTLPEYKKDIYNIFPEKELKKECEDIITNPEIYGFRGTPYIDITDVDGNQHGFIDAAGFTISLIVYYEKSWKISPNNSSKFKESFQKSIEFLSQSYINGKGWSFTNYDLPQEPFLYATWMALDTLSDLISTKGLESKDYMNSESMKIMKELKTDFGKLSSNLEEKHIGSDPIVIEQKEYNQSIVNDRIGFDDDDIYIHYNLWIVMSLLFLGYKKDADILQALKIIQSEHQKSDKAFDSVTKKSWETYFETDREIKRKGKTGSNLNNFSDRAFLAQYLKSIVMFLKLFPNYKDTKEINLEEAYENLLNNRKWIPEENRIDSEEWVNYWDQYAQSGGYAIYYTERAIEALCSYYSYLDEQQEEEPEKGFVKISFKNSMLISIENLDEIIEEKLKDSKTFKKLNDAIEELNNSIKNMGKMDESEAQKRAKGIKEMTEIIK